jgi:hypothetical protein
MRLVITNEDKTIISHYTHEWENMLQNNIGIDSEFKLKKDTDPIKYIVGEIEMFFGADPLLPTED